jgi:hypothetical protein
MFPPPGGSLSHAKLRTPESSLMPDTTPDFRTTASDCARNHATWNRELLHLMPMRVHFQVGVKMLHVNYASAPLSHYGSQTESMNSHRITQQQNFNNNSSSHLGSEHPNVPHLGSEGSHRPARTCSGMLEA